jgi:hypothetical protein
MKKTAVEWFYKQILLTPLDIRSINKCLEQAKEMEKQQIMKARQDIFHTGNLTNEEYYNETFKSE